MFLRYFPELREALDCLHPCPDLIRIVKAPNQGKLDGSAEHKELSGGERTPRGGYMTSCRRLLPKSLFGTAVQYGPKQWPQIGFPAPAFCILISLNIPFYAIHPMQEPCAVVPHARICAGRWLARAIPTATICAICI
jgi:hypothetical protein